MRIRHWSIAGGAMFGGAILGLAGCGGSGGGGAASCSPGPTATMSITSGGLSPTNVCVQPGGQVTFTNNDSARHHIQFEVAGCPTLDEMSPGATATGTFATTANCTFHDGDNPANAAYRGTVAVSSVMVSGGGY